MSVVCYWREHYDPICEKERFDALYQQHLTQLKLQGKRAKTI